MTCLKNLTVYAVNSELIEKTGCKHCKSKIITSEYKIVKAVIDDYYYSLNKHLDWFTTEKEAEKELSKRKVDIETNNSYNEEVGEQADK